MLRLKEMGCCCFFHQEEKKEEENTAFYCQVWTLYLQATDHLLICVRDPCCSGISGKQDEAAEWALPLCEHSDTLEVPNAGRRWGHRLSTVRHSHSHGWFSFLPALPKGLQAQCHRALCTYATGEQAPWGTTLSTSTNAWALITTFFNFLGEVPCSNILNRVF